MIERKRVVAKVVELMDQIGDMQASRFSSGGDEQGEKFTHWQQTQQGILAKALVVDHLMWVLDLGDPNLPGAALVREEYERNLEEANNG